MKVDVWMPLYIGDYLADTMHLTTDQHGAYMLLMMYAWKNGGRIPCDTDTLANITRMQIDAMEKNREVLAGFFKVEGKHWIQPRLMQEIEKAQSRKDTAGANGRKGGRPRKQAKNEDFKENENPEETQKKPAGFENQNPEKTGRFSKQNPEKSSSPSPSHIDHRDIHRARAHEDQPKPEPPDPDIVQAVYDTYPDKRADGTITRKALLHLDRIRVIMTRNPDYPLLRAVQHVRETERLPKDFGRFLDELPDPRQFDAKPQEIPDAIDRKPNAQSTRTERESVWGSYNERLDQRQAGNDA